MAHRVGDVEADVVLVQPDDVVKVAADLAARPICTANRDARHFRQRLRQETRLEPAGRFQVQVNLLVCALER